jgi:phosphoribosylamine--glycine ligase
VARRILVVGSGGREHALAWRLSSEPGVERVIVAPGNPGMSDVAYTAPRVLADDAGALGALVESEDIDLVVIGPEAPLVDGVADRLVARGVRVFGPDAQAARLEGSKGWCRDIAMRAGVPVPDGESCDDPVRALAAARRFGGRVAVKADGLAAGKGVIVCHDVPDAEAAIRALMVGGAVGAAGKRVVVEEALVGSEASVIAIADRTACLAFPAARDHKRLLDGDRGPNTGGMGVVSPPDDLPERVVADIVARVHRPVLAELARRGIVFRGALFAGLMLTEDGPRLLEFNVRLGDPEAQAILPRLDVPLGALLEAATRDRLAETAADLGIAGSLLPVRPAATAAVVLAAPGYPGEVSTGAPIEGIAAARGDGALLFFGGVRADADAGLRTAGGRVMTVVGEGTTVEAAADHAYRAAAHVWFAGRQLRTDIGRGGSMAATSR